MTATEPCSYTERSPVSWNVNWCQRGNSTYSWSAQSNPAGQSRYPVRSCRKPRSDLLLRDRGGISACPVGVIQSMMTLFKLFVSSDLALDIPFCTFQKTTGGLEILAHHVEQWNELNLRSIEPLPLSLLISGSSSWEPSVEANEGLGFPSRACANSSRWSMRKQERYTESYREVIGRRSPGFDWC